MFSKLIQWIGSFSRNLFAASGPEHEEREHALEESPVSRPLPVTVSATRPRRFFPRRPIERPLQHRFAERSVRINLSEHARRRAPRSVWVERSRSPAGVTSECSTRTPSTAPRKRAREDDANEPKRIKARHSPCDDVPESDASADADREVQEAITHDADGSSPLNLATPAGDAIEVNQKRGRAPNSDHFDGNGERFGDSGPERVDGPGAVGVDEGSFPEEQVRTDGLVVIKRKRVCARDDGLSYKRLRTLNEEHGGMDMSVTAMNFPGPVATFVESDISILTADETIVELMDVSEAVPADFPGPLFWRKRVCARDDGLSYKRLRTLNEEHGGMDMSVTAMNFPGPVATFVESDISISTADETIVELMDVSEAVPADFPGPLFWVDEPAREFDSIVSSGAVDVCLPAWLSMEDIEIESSGSSDEPASTTMPVVVNEDPAENVEMDSPEEVNDEAVFVVDAPTVSARLAPMVDDVDVSILQQVSVTSVTSGSVPEEPTTPTTDFPVIAEVDTSDPVVHTEDPPSNVDLVSSGRELIVSDDETAVELVEAGNVFAVIESAESRAETATMAPMIGDFDESLIFKEVKSVFPDFPSVVSEPVQTSLATMLGGGRGKIARDPEPLDEVEFVPRARLAPQIVEVIARDGSVFTTPQVAAVESILSDASTDEEVATAPRPTGPAPQLDTDGTLARGPSPGENILRQQTFVSVGPNILRQLGEGSGSPEVAGELHESEASEQAELDRLCEELAFMQTKNPYVLDRYT